MGTAGQLIVGRYRLVRALGQGGMGIVWEGHDTLLNRPVAIRQVLLPPDLGETRRLRLVQRLSREARRAERLRHPAIAAVYDVAEEDGTPYIVMELVRSRSLEGLVSGDGPLPPERAASLARALLGALAHAHANGVRHGDVRPSNVLVGHDGRVVLADFGTAALAADPLFTRRSPEPAHGAPRTRGIGAFLAPERAEGGALTPAGDLWSLGATLHFAVTGRPPAPAPDGPTGGDAGVPSPAPDGMPEALRSVINGLLAREPRKRLDPEVARRLLAELEPAAPPTAPSAGRGAGRTRLIAGVAGAAVLAAAVGGWAMLRDRPTGAKAPLAAPVRSALPASASAGSRDAGPTASPAPRLKLTEYRSEAGWRADVPKDWTVRPMKFSVRWLDPDGRGRLDIEVTAQSGTDPLGTLREAEAIVRPTVRDYRKLRLTTVADSRGPAADWEFTWTQRAAKDGLVAGATYHQIRRVLSTSTGTAVLTWTTTDAEWERLRPTQRKVFSLFRPTG